MEGDGAGDAFPSNVEVFAGDCDCFFIIHGGFLFGVLVGVFGGVFGGVGVGTLVSAKMTRLPPAIMYANAPWA